MSPVTRRSNASTITTSAITTCRKNLIQDAAGKGGEGGRYLLQGAVTDAAITPRNRHDPSSTTVGVGTTVNKKCCRTDDAPAIISMLIRATMPLVPNMVIYISVLPRHPRPPRVEIPPAVLSSVNNKEGQ